MRLDWMQASVNRDILELENLFGTLTDIPTYTSIKINSMIDLEDHAEHQLA